jgi:enoyl-CoA hydratase/carnithine racemase
MDTKAATAEISPNEAILLREDSGGIARLVLNRPTQRNALNQALLDRLNAEIAAVSADDAVRAVIIAANGPGFCAGHDLKEVTDHRSDADGGRAFLETLFASCSRMMQAIVNSPKIFIAEVQGAATAAGCQLVATCDLSVASDTARFGVNGINIGAFCSTPMVAVSRNLGRKKAMELLTTGGLMSAEEARLGGIVNEVVAPQALTKATRAMAMSVADKSLSALAMGKKAFYEQLSMPLDEAYRCTTKVIVDNFMLDDAREGIRAFLEKRKPRWRDA